MRILHHLRHATAQRTALLGLLLLLVGWQDFAAQSHVHFRDDQSAAASRVAGHDAGQNRHAPAQGRGDCSLCQIVLGGNAPIIRALLLLLAPVLTLSFLLPAARLVAAQSAISHSWQSRGPPLI
jgi:hypothetical protein